MRVALEGGSEPACSRAGRRAWSELAWGHADCPCQEAALLLMGGTVLLHCDQLSVDDCG